MHDDFNFAFGKLHDQLIKAGIHIPNASLSAGGGWRINIWSRGGLIWSQPEVRYDRDTDRATVAIRRLFGRRQVKTWKVTSGENDSDLLAAIASTVIQHVRL